MRQILKTLMRKTPIFYYEGRFFIVVDIVVSFMSLDTAEGPKRKKEKKLLHHFDR